MSHAERSQTKGKKQVVKPAKAATEQSAAKTKEQLDEEAYQAELKKEEEEAKEEQKKKEIAAMNNVGKAIKQLGEEKVTEKEVAVDASVLAQEATKLAADASQVAADATIVAGEATEVTKKELITSHPDGCAVFGNFDVTSEYCKDCLVQFAECATACQVLTDSKKVKPGKASKSTSNAGKSTGPRPKTGPVSKFSGSYLTMKNGRIDTSLEIAKTISQHAIDASTTESPVTESLVKRQIAWLELKYGAVCHKVVSDGKVHFELNTTIA